MTLRLVRDDEDAGSNRGPDPRRCAWALREGDSLGNRTIERRPVGTLAIRSGRICAGDPLVNYDAPPLDQAVPIGRFEVYTTVVNSPSGMMSHEFAWIRFRDGDPARWVSAGAYGVDSGTGGFWDPKSTAPLEREDAFDQIEAAGRAETGRGCLGEDVAFFTSGAGDGVYSSAFGLDDRGQPLVLVTDFDLEDIATIERGGPEDSDLFSLMSFLSPLEFGRPREDWINAHLPGGNLQPKWDDSDSGFVLCTVLENVDHPARREALRLYWQRRISFLEQQEIDCTEQKTVAARLDDTTVDLDQLHFEWSDAHWRTARELWQKFPPRQVMSWEKQDDATNPMTILRALERQDDAQLAREIREIAPLAPSFDELEAGVLRWHAVCAEWRRQKRSRSKGR